MKKTDSAKVNTFPYLNSGPASNTSGSLGASNEGSDLSIPHPENVETPLNRGRIIPGNGNTDYIDTNTTSHGILAGNS